MEGCMPLTLMVQYNDGPSVLHTQGQGEIQRGVPRPMDEVYAVSLIESGQVEAADEESKARYEAIVKERLAENPDYNPAERK